MHAGVLQGLDVNGNVVAKGKRLQGRCCECYGEDADKRLSNSFCLCGDNPLVGTGAKRGAVKWVCLRPNPITGQHDCLARHFHICGFLQPPKSDSEQEGESSEEETDEKTSDEEEDEDDVEES